MKMHEHDQDIIMALAEGSLDPATAERAAAAISACPECSADFELQKSAVAALQDAPRVYLTAAESARLHDRLRQELRVAPAKPARAKPTPAWSRWAALAAGTAAVLLAAFLVLPSVLGGSDDDADTVAFELTEDDSNQADLERTATTAAAAEAPTAGALEEAGDDMMALQDAATETTAAPEDAAAPADTLAVGDGALTYVARGSLNERLRQQIVDQLIADAEAFGVVDEQARDLQPELGACLSVLFDSDADLTATAQIIGVIIDETGAERTLVALFDEENPAKAVLASITLPECEVFETLP
jgi:hypothetical protein